MSVGIGVFKSFVLLNFLLFINFVNCNLFSSKSSTSSSSFRDSEEIGNGKTNELVVIYDTNDFSFVQDLRMILKNEQSLKLRFIRVTDIENNRIFRNQHDSNKTLSEFSKLPLPRIVLFFKEQLDRACLLTLPSLFTKKEFYTNTETKTVDKVIDWLNEKLNLELAYDGTPKDIRIWKNHILSNLYKGNQCTYVNSTPADASRNFFHQYVSMGKPVVFKNATSSIWKAISLWNDQYLTEKFGHSMLNVKAVPNGDDFEGCEDASIWQKLNPDFHVPTSVLERKKKLCVNFFN